MEEQIKQILADELLKRGFTAPIELTVKGDKIKVTSANFNTVPVLFRAIRIRGNGTIKDNKIYIAIDAEYDLFEGGYNGVKLFRIMMLYYSNMGVVLERVEY